MVKHHVSGLEFDFIESKVGSEKTDDFRRYIDRETDDQGELVFSLCPNYGEDVGCTIHEIRPYSCRMYGHYREDNTDIVAHCVFRDTVKVVQADKVRTEMPYQARLTSLLVEYSSYHAPPTEDIEVDPELEENLETDREKAIFYLAQGRDEEAKTILEPLARDSSDPVILASLGRSYQGVGDYKSAAAPFQRVLQLQPDNPRAHYELGSNFVMAGQHEEAKQPLLSSLELEPGNAMASGFLGMIYATEGNADKALEYYERAMSLETYPTAFRFQLAQVYFSLQRRDDAERMFTAALECEFTAEQAKVCLEQLALLETDW